MDAVGRSSLVDAVTAEEGTETNLYALRLTFVGKVCESESAPDLALTPRRFEYDTSSLGMKENAISWCTIGAQ
jgi:hypothetical protein